ncbi:MAG: homocysteine S-methyltransferase family protein [Opitutales bacterium]
MSSHSGKKPYTAKGERLRKLLGERIVYLDGAMGTMVQQKKLTEADYRGDRFKDWDKADLKGNNDLLVLTKPDVIAEIHRAFLEAGSDLIETDTFNSTTISQADYGLEEIVDELNVEAAKLARQKADDAEADGLGEKWVAGAIGPLNRTLSMSRDVNDPGKREVTFDQVKNAYLQQVRSLVQGGVDVILIETIFDTLNAKAAIFAVEEFFEGRDERLPVMISGTITDQSGRTLSGQTTEAFWNSVRHAKPLSVGMNCALGADLMRPYIEELARLCPCAVSCYPNAGLPDPLSPTGFPEGPPDTAKALEGFASDGLLNVVGGCCGTTPGHIQKIREVLSQYPARKYADEPSRLRLSGLEPLVLG